MNLIIDALRSTYDILHLFYHRNKNQHRRGHWWKWLSMLKRCVKKLRGELVGKELCRFRARIGYMKNILLPTCYVSFTQLVQDNQFSALGLALIAEIAKISKTISSFADPEEESEDNPATIRTAEGFSARGPTEDLGEAVGSPINLDSTVYDSAVPATNQLPSRPMQEGVTQRCPSGDADGTGNLDSIRDAQPAKVQSVARLSANEVNLISSGPSRKPKSNKKRQSNPIDDLFDGLG